MNCIEFLVNGVKLPDTNRAVVENCINQMENCARWKIRHYDFTQSESCEEKRNWVAWILIQGSGFSHKLRRGFSELFVETFAEILRIVEPHFVGHFGNGEFVLPQNLCSAF